jgi:hypothetical protein
VEARANSNIDLYAAGQHGIPGIHMHVAYTPNPLIYAAMLLLACLLLSNLTGSSTATAKAQPRQ